MDVSELNYRMSAKRITFAVMRDNADANRLFHWERGRRRQNCDLQDGFLRFALIAGETPALPVS